MIHLSAAILGLAFILAFFSLMLFFAISGRNRPERHLRDIPAFLRLRRAVGLAVEAGNRLHFSIGRGNIISPHAAVGFLGLSMLERVARYTAMSDRPPIATTGEGSLGVLSQDVLHSASRYLGAEFDPASSRLTGLTPFSYAAGTIPVIQDEEIGANLLVGSFGSEVGLIAEAGERSGSQTLAGTDNLSGQVVLFAAAQEPLIGEEIFAGGAYLGAGGMHVASLRAQDVIRWLLIFLVVIGAILKLVGVL